MTALIETEFAGYHVQSLIGRGGMGVVYRAIDLALERPVALKVLGTDLGAEPDFRRRFAMESKLAASLDHPNIIPIHAAGEYEGVLYIAMRFVPGEDLRALLRAHGRLEPPRVAHLVGQVAAALDAAHAHGLVHRDVKPANVLVTAEDHVYLTDFGLSKRLTQDSQATRTGNVLGTLDYLAPEQIRAEPVGPFTDVYALGCMTVHLLTGEVPFPLKTQEAKLWAHLSEPAPRPGERVPELGRRFDVPVAQAMSKRPSARHPSAGALAAAVRAGATPAPAPVPPAPAPSPDDSLNALLPVRPVRAPRRVPAPRVRRELLTAALIEPFNVVVLGVLLVIGAALQALALMLPLALAVYAAGVVRSYRDPDTERRVERRRSPPTGARDD